LALSAPLWAKDRNWQDAQVMRTLGAIPQRGQYWIRGANTTYVIHNYANGSLVQWWLRLTLGGTVRVYSDGKNLHVIDNEGKERKCQILQEMVNPIADAYLAKEAGKTTEQLAAEKAQRDSLQLQQQALAQQMVKNATSQNSKTKVEVQVKDCTKYPALCVE